MVLTTYFFEIRKKIKQEKSMQNKENATFSNIFKQQLKLNFKAKIL